MTTPRERAIAEAKDVLCPGMPGPHLLKHDNPCDRKQMGHALMALGDAGRLSFVAWCCRLARQCPQPQVVPRRLTGKPPRVEYPVTDAVADLLALTTQYGVPAPKVLEELDRLARLQGKT
jgi:hypothetical protein